MKFPAVFLDRDGTLNLDTGYVRRPEDVKLLPGSGEAVRMLNEVGFKVVLVTNQSGVARGLMTTEDVDDVNERLCELLADFDARIDGIYYCPHLPDGTMPQFTRECDCRKPKPGLLLKATEEMDLDLKRSFMVGDSPRDIEAGQAVGARTILIDRGIPVGAGPEMARSVLEAAQTIVELSGLKPPNPAPVVAPEPQPVVSEEPRSVALTPEPTSETLRSVSAEPVKCAQCGSLIPDADLEDNRAAEVEGRMLCRDCHIYHMARNTQAREVTNADILAELKNITRTLTFEKFSIFNIFGGLAQAGAFAALLYAAVGPDKATGLQLVIALQLLALTFFILGRQ